MESAKVEPQGYLRDYCTSPDTRRRGLTPGWWQWKRKQGRVSRHAFESTAFSTRWAVKGEEKAQDNGVRFLGCEFHLCRLQSSVTGHVTLSLSFHMRK